MTLMHVAVVGVPVLALDGEGGDAVFDDQSGGHVVLSGQRVGGAQSDLGPAGLERAHEARGLAGDVQARADADAGQRLLLLEPFPDHRQDRHLLLGPFDPEDARLRPGLCP